MPEQVVVLTSYPKMSEDMDPYPFCFDPMYLDPIVSWEFEMVEILREEGNREELEWLVRMFTVCEPYPVEDLEPMDQAYPFSSEDIDSYVSWLIDPWTNLYEYDDAYYLGPEANYGFDNRDFICLDDDRGLALGMPPGLWATLFPPPRAP